MIVPDRQKIDEPDDENRADERIYDNWGGKRGEGEGGRANGGDPINSNGDEDIPNLSAIYRE